MIPTTKPTITKEKEPITPRRENMGSHQEGLLFRLASQIRKSLDLDTILKTAVNEIKNGLQIDNANFIWYLAHPIYPNIIISHQSDHNDQAPNLPPEFPPELVNTLSALITNLEPLEIDDINQLSSNTIKHPLQPIAKQLQPLNIASILLIPLKTHTGQLGGILCTQHNNPRYWTQREIDLLQAVVDQLAIAIEQAELYAQTRAAALAAQTQAQQLEIALQELKATEAKLIQNEKMSSLGQMVAGIAHEINNPVNFITGNITHTNNYIQDLLQLIKLYQQHYPNPHPDIEELTQEIDLDFLIEDLPQILRSMEIGAERIQKIVLSLRNFSRLDESDKKRVDIHEGLESTLLILHNRIKPLKKPDIQIIKNYSPLPPVECYPGQLNQVFMNIIANAIDALEENTTTKIITITTKLIKQGQNQQSLPNCDTILISISDNGTGMTPDIKKRLFDPFFTTKPVGKGTGLGLSICYQIIVQKHSGDLKCISQPGQGTEFWIQIPFI